MYLNFEEAYKKYLIYIDNKLKQQTKRVLKGRFENQIIPYWREFNVFCVNEFDYLKWQNEIELNSYSNNYKKNLHYLMTNFFDFLIKYFNIEKNIPRLVGNFKLKNEIKKYNIYSCSEFNRFIKCVDNEIYKQFFNLLFFTGLRPGEAMALKFTDLDKRILSINKTIDEHGSREIGTPKTVSSIREIEIDRKLNRDILKLKKIYCSKYNEFSNNYFIFGGIKPLSPTTINRYKIKACQKANIKPIKLHEFRHSHATMLVEKKLMIKEVSRRLGHSDSNITLNVYTHATKVHEKKVIKTLNFIRLFH